MDWRARWRECNLPRSCAHSVSPIQKSASIKSAVARPLGLLARHRSWALVVGDPTHGERPTPETVEGR